MNEITRLENELVNRIEELQADIEAMQQPRSDFALEHFVVGSHDTPGRQRMQAVLELQLKLFAIRRTQLDERKMRVQIEQQKDILASWKGKWQKELAAIEIERIETDLAEMQLARLGNIREARCLLALVEKLPKRTYEELQEEEAVYWLARLSRQALTSHKAYGRVDAGNMEAIQQMFRKIGTHAQSLDAESLESIGMIGLERSLED